jgi:hypothetical protein
MNTYSIFIVTTLLFFGYSASSFTFNPTDDILDKSNVTWAAEVYTDYAPNMNHHTLGRKKMQTQYGVSTNTFVSLKIQQFNINNQIQLKEISLAQQFLNLKENSNFKLFKDAELKEALSYTGYQKAINERSIDTTFIPQPDGTVRAGFIKINGVYANEIKLFRVKQILHYNKKTNELDLTPIAIAPVFCVYNKDGELTSTHPLFWMPIQDIAQETDLNLASINWAKRIIRSIDTEEVTVIKGKETLAEILRVVLDGFAETPNSSKIRHTYGNLPLMSPAEVKKINSGIDTIITFDPVTFEEVVSEVKNTITPETMHNVRIIQDWVWNKETQKLSIQLVAFAPIIKIYDNKKNYLGTSPMFYKKPNE